MRSKETDGESRQIIRRRFLGALVMVIAMIAGTPHSLASSPPNIVVILADDLGWNAVGYHNDQFVTPNIDSLVASGMELNRFYVAPMCSPTRAGLMTGRYPIRFGGARAVIPPQRDFGLPTNETTLGEALAKIGYANRGVFGKWHLGHRRAKWHPLMQGFTHFHGHYNGAIDYFELTREGQRDWHTDFAPSDEQGYSTDLIAASAAKWITDSASRSDPYFCYVPFNAPHSPFQAPPAAIRRFDHMREGAEASPRGRRRADGEASIRQTYAAMIWKMDQGIGQILKAIDASGEADNTIVWFFSDNGGVGNIKANNDPLRGSKLTVYEGGVRVPAAVRWPAKIQPGSVCDDVCGYIDLFPTLIAAAGSDANSLTNNPLDGVNLTSVLFGNNDPQTRRKLAERPWYSYHGQAGEQDEHLSVTSDGWKLKVNGPRLRSLDQLADGTRAVELFHLAEDPFERSDLKEVQTGRVQQLGSMLVEFRALQPADSVPPYKVGSAGFVPPLRWELDPSDPDRLVGSHK